MSLSRLATLFGFRLNAFLPPPNVAPDSEKNIKKWKTWLLNMEANFLAEHEAKPLYPDFTKNPYREILQHGGDELASLLDENGGHFPSIIGGKKWGGTRGTPVVSSDPFTGKNFAYSWGCPSGQEADEQLEKMLKDSLAASQGSWGSHEAWPERVRTMMHAARLALHRIPIFLAAMVTEVGMSPREAFGEYDEVIDFIRGYAMEATKVYLDEWFRPPKWKGEIHGHRASSHGVILSVAPFNFPAAIGVSMTFSALVMGNTVVHCPSEKTIVCGWLDYLLARDAIATSQFDPEKIIHFAVSNRGDTVRELLDHPEVAGLSFTGSSDVFERLVKEYGSFLRWNGSRSLIIGAAETSGVNPVYVAEDADVSKAASELPGSFLGRSGHKCSSSRFILVHDRVYEEFKQKFFAAIDALPYGNVFEGAFFGPVVSHEIAQELAAKIWRMTQESDANCTLLYEKKIQPTGGFDMPAVVLEAKPDLIYQEEKLKRLRNTELFGPVTCLMRVSSLEEAIRVAGLSDFALTASVYTGSIETASQWSARVRAGNSNVNKPPTGALGVSQWFGGPPSRSGGNWGAKGPDLVRRLRSEKAVSVKMPDGLKEDEQEAWIAKYRQMMTFSRKV